MVGPVGTSSKGWALEFSVGNQEIEGHPYVDYGVAVNIPVIPHFNLRVGGNIFERPSHGLGVDHLTKPEILAESQSGVTGSVNGGSGGTDVSIDTLAPNADDGATPFIAGTRSGGIENQHVGAVSVAISWALGETFPEIPVVRSIELGPVLAVQFRNKGLYDNMKLEAPSELEQYRDHVSEEGCRPGQIRCLESDADVSALNDQRTSFEYRVDLEEQSGLEVGVEVGAMVQASVLNAILGAADTALPIDLSARYDFVLFSSFDEGVEHRFRVVLDFDFSFWDDSRPRIDRVKDMDNDGIDDDDDNCPGTPPNTEVDATGCAIVVDENFELEADEGLTSDADKAAAGDPLEGVADDQSDDSSDDSELLDLDLDEAEAGGDADAEDEELNIP